MEYYSACVRRNGILIHATTMGMNLENMLSEVSHKGPNIMWFYLYEVCRQIHRVRKQNRHYQNLEGRGNGDLVFNGYSFHLRWWKSSELNSSDDYTTIVNALNALNCILSKNTISTHIYFTILKKLNKKHREILWWNICVPKTGRWVYSGVSWILVLL